MAVTTAVAADRPGPATAAARARQHPDQRPAARLAAEAGGQARGRGLPRRARSRRRCPARRAARVSPTRRWRSASCSRCSGTGATSGACSVPRDLGEPAELGATVSPTRDAVRYLLVLDVDPLGARAIRTVARLDADLPVDCSMPPACPAATASLAGDTAITEETVRKTEADLARVIPVVALIVLVILAVFLRALVAPAVSRSREPARARRQPRADRARLPGPARLRRAHLLCALHRHGAAGRARIGLQRLPGRAGLGGGPAPALARGRGRGRRPRDRGDHGCRPRPRAQLRAARDRAAAPVP